MVNFILGRANSGKSARINKIVLEKVKNGNKKIIIVVPEQMSFEKEKFMLDFLGNKDFSKIKVLSFSRMVDFVSGILRIPKPNVKSDVSQIIMVSQAIEKSKSSLEMYKKSYADINLAELILETIHEFKANKINKESLKKIYDNCKEGILKQKIKEIISIYETYEEMINEDFSDPMDNLNVLEDMISSGHVFEDYTFFFDGFSNFTAQQFSIIKEIIVQVEDVYMSFCIDTSANEFPEYSLFLPVQKTISKIKKIASEIPRDVNEIEINGENTKNEDLKLLEENIFKPSKIKFLESPENISIYNAFDLNDECEYVAGNIQKLICEKNYRYKDFVILTRDMNLYENYLKSSLKRHNIPYFMDVPEKLFNKNLIILMISAFDILHNNFSPEDVLRYLKTGLAGFTSEEVSVLENYVLMWNIKSEMWMKNFEAHPKGYYKEFEPEDIEYLQKINSLRERFLGPIEKFKKRIYKASGKEISTALYKLLIDINAPENLKIFCENLEVSSSQSAEKHAMIWDVTMEVLNEVANALSEKKISSRKYLEIFKLALNFTDFSYVPQCVDNVTVSSVERSNLTGSKVAFIIGAVNGEFPKVPSSSEIFTDKEVSYISSLGAEIKDTREIFLMKERFIAYTAVSSAKEKLFISWPSADSFKKSKFPSEIIKEIRDIFPYIRILHRSNFSDQDFILSKSTAFEVYAGIKNSGSKISRILEKFLSCDEEYKKKCESIKLYLDEDRFNFKVPENAKDLFKENLKLSASQIEKYHKCRFAYFCEYGLKIKPKNLADFNFMDYGTLIHYLFEKLFKKYGVKSDFSFTQEEIEKEISNLLENYINQKLGGLENKPKFFLYTIERLKNSVIFLMKHFKEEFDQSEFKVFDTEIEISKHGKVKPLNFPVSENSNITIEGKVDRADIMRNSSGNYVRIIDYKTGTKTFKLSDVFYGLNMQMLIYLLTISKNGMESLKNLKPAGILYFNAIKPVAQSFSGNNSKKVFDDIEKKLKMNGLIIDNQDVIKGMEKDASGKFIPATIKNGEIKKSDSLISEENLEVIYRYIKKLIKTMGNDILNGKFSANPRCNKNDSLCKWCKYKCICGYENDYFIDVNPMTNEFTIEKMKESELENGKQMDKKPN